MRLRWKRGDSLSAPIEIGVSTGNPVDIVIGAACHCAYLHATPAAISSGEHRMPPHNPTGHSENVDNFVTARAPKFNMNQSISTS